MPLVGRADKVVVRNIQLRQQRPKLLTHFVTKLLWRYTLLLGARLHFLTVFVDPGQEMHPVAHLSPETRNGVRQHFFIGVAQVWRTVHVVDGGRNVEGLHVELVSQTPRSANVESFDAPSAPRQAPGVIA